MENLTPCLMHAFYDIRWDLWFRVWSWCYSWKDAASLFNMLKTHAFWKPNAGTINWMPLFFSNSRLNPDILCNDWQRWGQGKDPNILIQKSNLSHLCSMTNEHKKSDMWDLEYKFTRTLPGQLSDSRLSASRTVRMKYIATQPIVLCCNILGWLRQMNYMDIIFLLSKTLSLWL